MGQMLDFETREIQSQECYFWLHCNLGCCTVLCLFELRPVAEVDDDVTEPVAEPILQTSHLGLEDGRTSLRVESWLDQLDYHIGCFEKTRCYAEFD